MLFLLATFLAPLVAVVPYEAAAPALVLVGFLMMQQVKDIDWDDLEIAIPAFLTIVLMPFTYSITVGIGAGLRRLRAHQDGRAARRREIHPLLWVVAGLFVVYFVNRPAQPTGHLSTSLPHRADRVRHAARARYAVRPPPAREGGLHASRACGYVARPACPGLGIVSRGNELVLSI